MKKPLTSVVLFFFLLFVGLFLGDGKQGVIEVFGVATVLVLWGLRFLQKGDIKQISKSLLFPWCAVAAAALLSTIFSSSIGFSVSWWTRLLSGYLIYRLFYDASSDSVTEVFVKGAIIFVFVASIFGAITYLFPWFHTTLPSMNLFSLTYGHNHLADLLVFVAPLLFGFIMTGHAFSWAKQVLFLGYSVVLFFTFARGAWVLVGAYGVYEYITAKTISDKQRMLKKTVVFLMIICVGIVTLLLSKNPIERARYVLRPQSAVGRLEYWRQAVEELKERPLVGYGPGTFSLISTRFQRAARQSSWFAHSEPLQIGAELGLVGVFAFIWLFWAHIQLFRRNRGYLQNSKLSRVLAASALLTFGYSLFEFTLDYFVVWLLFWATIGLLTGKASDSERVQQRVDRSIQISLVIIGVFYLLWTVGNVVAISTRRHDIAFYFAPFDSINALAFLDASIQSPPSDTDLSLVKFFHRKNPVILFALGKLTNNSTEETVRYQEAAVVEDPQNVEYFIDYINILVQQKDYSAVARAVKSLAGNDVDLEDPSMASLFTSEIFRDANTMATSVRKDEYVAKIYYLLGLAAVDTQPQLTHQFWTAASKREPNWGYFPIQLAALEYRKLHDKKAAQHTLQQCQRIVYTAKWCESFMNNLDELPLVGALQKNIIAIPKIIRE